MKQNQNGDKKAVELKRLKQLYPEADQRESFAMKKLSTCKLKNPVIVRIQPLNDKMDLPTIFFTLMLERNQKIGKIIGILCNRLNIDSKTSIFCFLGNKKLVQITRDVGDVYDENKE